MRTTDVLIDFMKRQLLIAILLLSSAMYMVVRAQSEQTQEIRTPRISLSYFNINNTEQRLVATVKTRVQGYYENVQDVDINFYRNSISKENFLASTGTDKSGKAVFTLPQTSDTALTVIYIATLENVPGYKDADKEITIQKARIEMSLDEIDSVKTVTVFIGTPDSTGMVLPVDGVTVGVFVKRLFGLLPITKEIQSTGEDGTVSLEFPTDIPGDDDGNLTIVAQVNDNDDFGNLEFSEVAAWGVPTALNPLEQKKELWLSSANTSEVILIITNVLLLGVISVIAFIIRQLVRIRKLGMHKE